MLKCVTHIKIKRIAICKRFFSTAQAEVRVRFAPSPTGFMHLGGMRTALYNYLVAKKNNGKLILRIEDTDQTRLVPGSTEDIIKNLQWACIEVSEGPGFGGEYGPYIQSQRIDIYHRHAKLLLETGHAYKCFCKTERLAELRSKQLSYDRACLKLSDNEIQDLVKDNVPYTIRMKVPRDSGNILVKDIIHGDTTFSTAAIDDQILLKSDGFPTYHLACVVDDHLMKISHVIRGEEWLTSTPKHILLYRAFGWEAPLFAHLPLLLNTDKTKLSKRHGHASVESYTKKGYLPSAVVNFVALLGWAPPSSTTPSANDELFYSIPSLVSAFSLSAVVLGGSVVNLDKLYWINTQHMQKMLETADGIASLISTFHPIINAAVLQHILLPCYESPHSIYFMKSEEFSPNTKAHVQAKSPKILEDLPCGVPLENVILSHDALQRHPLLALLHDKSYIHQVVLTVRERLHTIGDIAVLAIPFFTEPCFGTTEALEMKKKLWSPSVYSLMTQLHNSLKGLSAEQWNVQTILEVVREYSKKDVGGKAHGMGGVFSVLRLLVMGPAAGAGVPQSFVTLGRDVVLRRLARNLCATDQSNSF